MNRGMNSAVVLGYSVGAIPFYRRVVALDPKFDMAHMQLGFMDFNIARGEAWRGEPHESFCNYVIMSVNAKNSSPRVPTTTVLPVIWTRRGKRWKPWFKPTRDSWFRTTASPQCGPFRVMRGLNATMTFRFGR